MAAADGVRPPTRAWSLGVRERVRRILAAVRKWASRPAPAPAGSCRVCRLPRTEATFVACKRVEVCPLSSGDEGIDHCRRQLFYSRP